MARRPYSDIVRDGVGRVLGSATVTITVYETGLAATVYAAATGGSALTGGATTTGTNGRFTVWVDDNDHPLTTVFTVTASKSLYDSDTGYVAL